MYLQYIRSNSNGKKALVIIDIHVVYIRHENLSDGTRTFKPNTHGAELAPDMKIASKNIFTKYKGNALSSEEFAEFIMKLRGASPAVSKMPP
jgi:23S rRNA pseudoU1915 N3-methylase RlmH